jgi:acetyl-CoA acetyltransferase
MALHDAAIIGYAETKIVEKSSVDIWDLGATILESLLERTGVEIQEIDGLLVNASITGAGNCFWAQTTADYLGLELDFCQSVDIGGCSAVGAVARAAAALDAGLCNTVLLLNADTSVSENNLHLRSFQREWTDPHGLLSAPADFGLLTKRYEHQHGLDYRALAKLAVTQRNHAVLNDLACEKLRKPITVEHYLNSRMIADPIRLLDCVMPCDGANGLLMTTRKSAKARKLDKIVVPLGYGERTQHRTRENIVDITEPSHIVAGARAFSQARLSPEDIGSFHPYDDFFIAVVMQLEALGFARKGRGCDYVLDTDFDVSGDLPLNTGGGQISAGQAGLAGGGTNLVEAVRQLFGEAGPRQVKATQNALVTGIGWPTYGRNWATSVALIMAPGS